MILDSSLNLEAVLGGAVTANQPEVHVDYLIWNADGTVTPPQPSRTVLNSTTDVTILAAPATNAFYFEVVNLSIYNKDTASATVIVKTDDGSNERIICKVTLSTLETLHYQKDRGWYVITANGLIKTGSIDYAEFTWTPVLTFATQGDLSVSYSAQVGSGTKKGREVTLTFAVVSSAFTHSTASGNCQITGSPYTAQNVSNLNHMGALQWGGITKANYTHVVSRITPNTAIIEMVACGSGQAASVITTTDVPSGGTPTFRGTLTFHT